jgi:acetyltransferase-like isoleucine patch superfamily enzyme
MKIIAYLYLIIIKLFRRVRMFLHFPLFKKCGENVKFGHSCEFSYERIEIGNDVFIGPGANFMSAMSTIKVGNKVMFGPGVTILGGDHRTNVVGTYMFDVHEKLPENDLDVVIEDDVWVGANVLILKGVKIGRGCIIGAGSIVVKSIPAYTIYVGSPGLKAWSRWDAKTIETHEHLLEE